MRGTLPALAATACVILAACGSDAGTTGNGTSQQFSALYIKHASAYDSALKPLGSTKLKDATAEQKAAVFDALSNADYDFAEGIGKLSDTGNMDTICSGGFVWKIHFADKDCPDVAALWRVTFQLATYEGAVAEDVKHGTDPTADVKTVTAEDDQWKAAAEKVKQDLGI